jgi:hypothetical protein
MENLQPTADCAERVSAACVEALMRSTPGFASFATGDEKSTRSPSAIRKMNMALVGSTTRVTAPPQSAPLPLRTIPSRDTPNEMPARLAARPCFAGCELLPVALVGPPGKNLVCHKGKKTLELPREAIGAHLDHGDHRGPCR